jgi:hypothetical protein
MAITSSLIGSILEPQQRSSKAPAILLAKVFKLAGTQIGWISITGGTSIGFRLNDRR